MYAPPIIFPEKRPVKKLSRLDRDPLQLPPPARDSMSSKNDTRKEKETTTTYYLRPKDGSKAVTTVKDKPAPTATASAPAAFLPPSRTWQQDPVGAVITASLLLVAAMKWDPSKKSVLVRGYSVHIPPASGPLDDSSIWRRHSSSPSTSTVGWR